MVRINSDTRYGSLDYFAINCVDECLDVLQDELIDRIVVNIIPVEQSHFLEDMGGACYNTKIIDKKFDGTRPPRINEILAEINLCINIRKLLKNPTFDDYFRKRFFYYIESVGAEVDDYSMFTMVLLHELGHCNLIKMFLNVGMEREYDNFHRLSTTTALVVASEQLENLWNEKYKVSLTQTTNATETYADLYALRNFPGIWNRVQKFVNTKLPKRSSHIITRYGKKFKDKSRYKPKPFDVTHFDLDYFDEV